MQHNMVLLRKTDEAVYSLLWCQNFAAYSVVTSAAFINDACMILFLELREARTNVYKYVAALICLISRKRFPSWCSVVQSVCDHT